MSKNSSAAKNPFFGLAGWPKRLSLNTLLQLVGVLLGLAGTWLITNRDSFGFVLWVGSNLALIALAVRTRLWGLALMYAVYGVLAVRGLLSW